MSDIKIIDSNDHIAVISPYEPKFVKRARELGGTWERKRKTWMFPNRQRDRVVEALDDSFGYEDAETYKERVIVRLAAGEKPIVSDKDAVRAAGRIIAQAWGRDSGAKLGPRVVLVKGSVRSGGSWKNWETIAEENSEFEVELPRMSAEKLVANPDPWSEVEIVQEVPTRPDRDALLERRKALQAELDEVEARLKEIEDAKPERTDGVAA